MQMILAEQTAMQASTVGSSLMFSRQTCRGNTAGQSVNQCRPYDPDHVCGQCSFSLQVHYDDDMIETQFSSPVLHIRHCYTPTLHNRCQGSCGWGRHRKTAGEKILFFKIKAQKCVHKLNMKIRQFLLLSPACRSVSSLSELPSETPGPTGPCSLLKELKKGIDLKTFFFF